MCEVKQKATVTMGVSASAMSTATQHRPRWVFVVVQLAVRLLVPHLVCVRMALLGTGISPATPWPFHTIGDPTLGFTDGPDRNSMWFAGPKFTSSIPVPNPHIHHTPHPGCKEDVLQRMRPQQAPEAWPKPGRSPSDPGWTLGFLKADTLRPLPAQAANQRRRVSSAARRGRRGWLVLSPEGRFIAFHHSSEGWEMRLICVAHELGMTARSPRRHHSGDLSPVGARLTDLGNLFFAFPLRQAKPSPSLVTQKVPQHVGRWLRACR